MLYRDKSIKESVEVRDSICCKRTCYWPRPDPGVFSYGSGYFTREEGKRQWFCGTREIDGCPDSSRQSLRELSGK